MVYSQRKTTKIKFVKAHSYSDQLSEEDQVNPQKRDLQDGEPKSALGHTATDAHEPSACHDL